MATFEEGGGEVCISLTMKCPNAQSFRYKYSQSDVLVKFSLFQNFSGMCRNVRILYTADTVSELRVRSILMDCLNSD